LARSKAITACSEVTVTSWLRQGAAAVETKEASDVGLSNCCVDSAPSTKLVNVARAAAPDPSSRLSSTSVASPAALSVGSGMATLRPASAGGPPADAGSSTLQPAGESKTPVSLATAIGMAVISGDSAISAPVGRMARAPFG
jgi:hypothetical protein